MKRIFLSGLTLLLFAGSCQAGIISNIFNRSNDYYYPPNAVRYNRGYYPPNYRQYNMPNRHYYDNRYYNQYPNNYYYNRQPVIYRTRYNKSIVNNNEKNVSNQLSGIDKLEKQILKQTFEGDTFEVRIERLEQKLLGAVQTGYLQERFYVLQSAAKTYKTFNPYSENMNSQNYAYRPPVFTGSTGSNWRETLWGNMRNQLTGTPTGFTPAMDPAYMDWFEAERTLSGSGMESDLKTNTGYRYSNTDRGSSTDVTILD